MSNENTIEKLEFSEEAKVTSVNPRKERHGEEWVQACDMNFEITVPNSFLNKLVDGLKPGLYRAEQSDDPIQSLGLEDDYLPMVRFPIFDKIPLKIHIEDAKLEVALPGKRKSIVLADVKLHKFRLQCEKGGTVIITFQAQFHPEEDDLGKLCAAAREEIGITVSQGTQSVGGQAEFDDDDADDEQDDELIAEELIHTDPEKVDEKETNITNLSTAKSH